MNERESIEFDAYQKELPDSSWHPKGGETSKGEQIDIVYHSLALCNESGEVAGVIKKVMRGDYELFSDETIEKLVYEMGDVLWYLARLADELGISLSTVAAMNLQKIRKRRETMGMRNAGSTYAGDK